MRNMIDSGQIRGVETRLVRWVTALARPERLSKLQLAVLLLLLFWCINSLAQLFWVVWPSTQSNEMNAMVLNPATNGSATQVIREPISLEGALGVGLFGNPEANVDAAVLAATDTAGDSREGIEDGARESRLALRLTGIVASTEDGLGSAVIEANNAEQTYAVGDALPAAGDVTLAKVMATQVVISNGGTYELIKLFEDNVLAGVVTESPPAVTTPKNAPRPLQGQPDYDQEEAVDSVDSSEAQRIATDVRRTLYEDPQSLAELVSVAAVRDDGGLRGYRVSPGKNPEQFRELGFRAGDVITAVNGLSLSDPANTLRLYQMMKDATDATFEIEREGGATSLSVSIGAL